MNLGSPSPTDLDCFHSLSHCRPTQPILPPVAATTAPTSTPHHARPNLCPSQAEAIAHVVDSLPLSDVGGRGIWGNGSGRGKRREWLERERKLEKETGGVGGGELGGRQKKAISPPLSGAACQRGQRDGWMKGPIGEGRLCQQRQLLWLQRGWSCLGGSRGMHLDWLVVMVGRVREDGWW